MKRVDGREPDQMREVKIAAGVLRHAEGSAMVEVGATKVICAATLQDRVPPHVVGTGRGWLTAEYAMLPRSSAQRIPRDGVRGNVAPRSTEIQRIVGRVLRSVFNLDKLGERTIIIDCDVIEADGGTRTASITGGFVALALAVRRLRAQSKVGVGLIADFAAATSVGIVEGQPVLDLCYLEDAQAEVDMNVAASGSGRFIEIQSTAEKTAFSRDELDRLLDLAQSGIAQLVKIQKEVLGIESFAEGN
ncbi:ribonuclease PH [Candidatus Sumerlaeota bacterium]|nr:ribonuclease PH [Candidatus Sumerlaeota bacterium]